MDECQCVDMGAHAVGFGHRLCKRFAVIISVVTSSRSVVSRRVLLGHRYEQLVALCSMERHVVFCWDMAVNCCGVVSCRVPLGILPSLFESLVYRLDRVSDVFIISS